ncbi:hypothetical protein CP533_6836 [Ophiocordyceps camponoti-saundersi (nom. inval.)]|nr:hypothetical protein CP533_6836 [Ophiocordyceps camponoti-saundersi (nom. inval.)]
MSLHNAFLVGSSAGPPATDGGCAAPAPTTVLNGSSGSTAMTNGGGAGGGGGVVAAAAAAAAAVTATATAAGGAAAAAAVAAAGGSGGGLADMDWSDLFLFGNGDDNGHQQQQQQQHQQRQRQHQLHLQQRQQQQQQQQPQQQQQQQQQQHHHHHHHHHQHTHGMNHAALTPALPDLGSPPEACLSFQPNDFSGVNMTGFGGGGSGGGRPEYLGMAEFFLKNGAWRPVHPCTHCKRLRLQCFILQTTAANPNPAHSCTSCAALFRQCSLAERSKRQHSHFETATPVIGNLHGVSEEGEATGWNHEPVDAGGEPPGDAPGEAPAAGMPMAAAAAQAAAAAAASSKRSSSRSVRRTQVLRDWFARNLDHPYPTDEEKTALADESGLSRTQVINWFTNARRRSRQSAHHAASRAALNGVGSPMTPSLLSAMTPLERWRNTPPEGAHVSESAIHQALSHRADAPARRLLRDGAGADGGESVVLGGGNGYPYSADGSVSANPYSHFSGDNNEATWPPRSSEDPFSVTTRNTRGSGRTRHAKPRTFTCGYCSRTFSKKYDWLRHERSLHAPGDVSWICAVPLQASQSFLLWRLGHDQPECVFCGQVSPTEEHFHSHEFEACSKRAVQDRSFSRKDHMWQHLYKFHGCRKWEGWKPDLNLLQHKA